MDDYLKDFDDEFLYRAYQEVKYLESHGSLPIGQKYFRELSDCRMRTFDVYYDMDRTKSDLYREICSRWSDNFESK